MKWVNAPCQDPTESENRVRISSKERTYATDVGIMNEIINHVEGLRAQMEEWLNIMSDDPHFAPPAWVMESMWTRLNLILALLDHK